jgi:two-component system, OmpR family, phosphate regulon response regulator PhoB
MRSNYILIVEDEAPVRQMTSFTLRRFGFQVAEAADAEAAQLCISARRPDLILVDWMLPTMSGLDLARMLKGTSLTQAIPIIMVTARVEELDRVTALDCAVDDYVTKPFSPRELAARINAVLRRTIRASHGKGFEAPNSKTTEASGLVLDTERRCLKVRGSTVQLAPTDFRLLQFFMTYPEQAHTREQLLDRVWGGMDCAEEHTVDVQIRRLRKALEGLQFDRLIQTVRGIGYRFSTRFE